MTARTAARRHARRKSTAAFSTRRGVTGLIDLDADPSNRLRPDAWVSHPPYGVPAMEPPRGDVYRELYNLARRLGANTAHADAVARRVMSDHGPRAVVAARVGSPERARMYLDVAARLGDRVTVATPPPAYPGNLLACGTHGGEIRPPALRRQILTTADLVGWGIQYTR
jgi:hypothetical protein